VPAVAKADSSQRLALSPEERQRLWSRLGGALEDYHARVEEMRVSPALDPEAIRSLLKPYDFARPVEPVEALDFAVRGLSDHQVHTPHPRYFGLFNPAPTTMGIVADALVAAFNPQLAAWSHSPLAAEIERHLVRAFGERFGYDRDHCDGTFASGGAEANHTALLTALVRAFPEFARSGLRALGAQPVLYVSRQTHHSFLKAARFCGLGTDAVHEIPSDETTRMDTARLAERVRADRAAGLAPFLVVATAGTTGAGVIDPLPSIATVAAREGLWLHVDAAWGGAAALVPELRGLLDGIERSDSLTFDAHKWLSVPMAAGLYLTRHPDILEQTCRITAEYMPKDAAGLAIRDPYANSLQWSRRFTGLKVFLSLAVAGWDGYAAAIRHQTAMGDRLRRELEAARWKVLNDTRLPVVCFQDGSRADGGSRVYLEAVARELVGSGRAWISTTNLGEATPVLRACITNYRTSPEDLAALRQALEDARQSVRP
jgi:glutamate/tyrosine decarboxylase-like PLP-dependent enzyme